MKDTLHIRAATFRSDRSELARLLDGLHRDAHIESDQEPEDEVLDWRKDGVFVVDRGGGRLGGFIHVGTRAYAEGAHESPVAFVEEWFVDRDLRRAGWGRALMRAAEGWARKRGHRELASDTTLDNRRSQRAHALLGFRVAEKLVSFIKPLR